MEMLLSDSFVLCRDRYIAGQGEKVWDSAANLPLFLDLSTPTTMYDVRCSCYDFFFVGGSST